MFRTVGADLKTNYRDGARHLVDDHSAAPFLASDAAVFCAVGLVLALSLTCGVREGLRAILATVGIWLIASPLAILAAAVGAFIGSLIFPPQSWLFLRVAYVGGGVAGFYGLVASARALLPRLGVRVKRVIWLHVLVGAVFAGWVTARDNKLVRAYAALAVAPALVVGEPSP